MSHSTVLVIGPNVEEQLAPFDENLAVEPYPKPVDADTLQRMIEHYRKEGTPTQQRTAVLARYDEATGFVLGVELADVQRLYHAYDDCELRLADQPKQSGDSAYVYLSTYNPRSRWDWFAVGGRWTGFYKLKRGARGLTGEPGLRTEKAKPGYADQCFKRDVDVEGMRVEAEIAAATRYDAAHRIIAGRVVKPWSEFLKERDAGTLTIDEARTRYHAQEVVKAFEAAGREWAFVEIEPLLVERAAYLQRARDDALTTFAVLQDGEWHEQGRMGWFGLVADEQDDWAADYAQRFDALPGDALLTIVDVHI